MKFVPLEKIKVGKTYLLIDTWRPKDNYSLYMVEILSVQLDNGTVETRRVGSYRTEDYDTYYTDWYEYEEESWGLRYVV